ncbi:hypothetical protein L7F22_069264 [Adiantum nelumboides]|nr:hypothetical protein [Adiantum nelumboides]
MSARTAKGRQATSGIRAKAQSLKKAWRRGRLRSRQLLENLLQQLSLSSGASSRKYSACCCMHSVGCSGGATGCDDVQNHRITCQNVGSLNNADVDDILDDLQIRPANHLMSSLATCCFKVHYLSYHPLINEDLDPQVDGSLMQQNCFSSSPCHESNATVLLKVSIIGDSNTGKTSFMAKYVRPEEELSQEAVDTVGVVTEEKVVHTKSGTRIAFNIWDLAGHWQCGSMVPLVCRDAVAILIMFDLTRRSTLNSVMDWFTQARECNKAAMTVIVGTKYDDFVELPQNIQLVVIQQARVYAKAMGAALFFSSVRHNINVHKVFKVIVAKLFDLPCPIPLNLNLGEPLVDY